MHKASTISSANNKTHAVSAFDIFLEKASDCTPPPIHLRGEVDHCVTAVRTSFVIKSLLPKLYYHYITHLSIRNPGEVTFCGKNCEDNPQFVMCPARSPGKLGGQHKIVGITGEFKRGFARGTLVVLPGIFWKALTRSPSPSETIVSTPLHRLYLKLRELLELLESLEDSKAVYFREPAHAKALDGK